jgi:hypothetical protein
LQAYHMGLHTEDAIILRKGAWCYLSV